MYISDFVAEYKIDVDVSTYNTDEYVELIHIMNDKIQPTYDNPKISIFCGLYHQFHKKNWRKAEMYLLQAAECNYVCAFYYLAVLYRHEGYTDYAIYYYLRTLYLNIDQKDATVTKMMQNIYYGLEFLYTYKKLHADAKYYHKKAVDLYKPSGVQGYTPIKVLDYSSLYPKKLYNCFDKCKYEPLKFSDMHSFEPRLLTAEKLEEKSGEQQEELQEELQEALQEALHETRQAELQELQELQETPAADKPFDHYKLLDNIHTLDDLITFGKAYDPTLNYSFDIKTLTKLVPVLEDFTKMIGLNSIKTNLFDQIIYYLQSFDKNKDMLHSVVAGDPGSGKTTFAYHLAKIYHTLGIIRGSKGKFKYNVAKRADLIAEFVGQTAPKTQRVIDASKGGVLVIDEVYSLGDNDCKQSFTKECVDTLMQNLSENKEDFICIIIGYKDQIEKCFFAQNKGLKRRFNFTYEMEEYTPYNLMEIFVKNVKDNNWKIDPKIDGENNELHKFIETNKESFKYLGGDMERLFLATKMSHSKRVFSMHPQYKKILTMDDIKNAFISFKKNEMKEEKEVLSDEIRHIYT